ncbi:hypothetical protein [Massilia sp. Se16.2.3]|uniref:hypothetical protein n=1 Tax=Massilia sp. Se16.2.3 TaxID=2709303 RepID=UPI001603C8AD|nr:hypothetical protein [Massilia sp. Se16.2.3]QNB00631.1 hypothetical protein G4G31_20465 [Massilia sp. Se16.2.3]
MLWFRAPSVRRAVASRAIRWVAANSGISPAASGRLTRSASTSALGMAASWIRKRCSSAVPGLR